MNIVSLNICGLGENRKKDWVQSLRRLHKASFFSLQETHLDGSHNREMIRECWGDYNFEFVYENAFGRSGGLVSIWDKNYFTSFEVIKSRSFFIVIGIYSAFSCPVAFVNVYGPQSTFEKRKLWEELLLIKNSRIACWIVFGDFNVVRRQEERINSMFCQSSANYFNKFIELSGFHEPKMGGFRFTYFQKSRAKHTKLDRFLVCSEFSKFPHISVTALPRDKSDHCPILLSQSRAKFGPLPFNLFNSWLTGQGFDEVVSKACREFSIFDPADAKLLIKLKAIKKAIREW
ncbi:uncharacterized protein LOC111915534 [Lactuca sativa]|uniref:uncharacterized protein LOC111915534 n=1 Tax=Lactuca sativa TaxID=4236 RepID=UPI000CD91DA7|nr:uncharacterized protein LOC111915534 [Lactuca sativa]